MENFAEAALQRCGALRKRYSENMQHIYRRATMPKCDFDKLLCNFIEVTFRNGCSPVNLLHIFRTTLSKNTYGEQLLNSLFTQYEDHYASENISLSQIGNIPNLVFTPVTIAVADPAESAVCASLL